MTSTRATLAALLALALVACAGGETGPGSGIPGPEQPEFNDQGPPGDGFAPRNSYGSTPNYEDQAGPNPEGIPSGPEAEPGPGPEPEPTQCSPEDQCGGCVEDCDLCLCVLDDPTLCEGTCQ
jgi:hypothetical protein